MGNAEYMGLLLLIIFVVEFNVLLLIVFTWDFVMILLMNVIVQLLELLNLMNLYLLMLEMICLLMWNIIQFIPSLQMMLVFNLIIVHSELMLRINVTQKDLN